jgi:hypothetical protein
MKRMEDIRSQRFFMEFLFSNCNTMSEHGFTGNGHWIGLAGD